MNEKILKQLQEKYERLLDEVKKYNEIYSKIITESREAGHGNFGAWWDSRPDLQHGWYLYRLLEKALFSLYLIIEKKENKQGYCDKWCMGCSGAHYSFEKKQWSCQETCECK